MFSKKGLVLIGLLFGFVTSLAAQTPAEDIEMIAQPNKCVALNQGRRCYAQVKVTWTSASQQNLCLIDMDNNRELYCWQAQQQGEYIYELASDVDIRLGLFSMLRQELADERVIMADTVIKISWLYEGNARKHRWRLF